jgi:hypothetical protein
MFIQGTGEAVGSTTKGKDWGPTSHEQSKRIVRTERPDYCHFTE